MPYLSDQELHALHDRIQYLQSELNEAKNLAAALEANLKTARKCDPNTGNPGGDAGNHLKEGETCLTMIENEKGRFVKMIMGPVLFPAEDFADKMNTDVESLWAANGPGNPEASVTYENKIKHGERRLSK